MTDKNDTPAAPGDPLTNKAFNTDVAALRAEVKAALIAGASGEAYDPNRKRPFKITKGDGTIVEYR